MEGSDMDDSGHASDARTHTTLSPTKYRPVHTTWKNHIELTTPSQYNMNHNEEEFATYTPSQEEKDEYDLNLRKHQTVSHLRNNLCEEGISVEEYCRKVYNEIFDFEENNNGMLLPHHKEMIANKELYPDYLNWKQKKLILKDYLEWKQQKMIRERKFN